METDSEDELPPGWEERSMLDGRVFYANHVTATTQWRHPRTNKLKRLPTTLPQGFERQIDDEGQVLYLDKRDPNGVCKSTADPRLAFAVEENEEDSTKVSHEASINQFRQRFDASSTANHVLHNLELNNKVVAITGCDEGGIGFEVARSVALKNAITVVICRTRGRAEEAIRRLKHICGHQQVSLVAMSVELASLASVRTLALQLQQTMSRLDVLVLNAGVMMAPERQTPDDLEPHFQINYLSQVYLVHLLKDFMSTSSLKPKVVFVSSESHRFAGTDQERLTSDPIYSNASVSGIEAYNWSKLLSVAFCVEASERWRKSGLRLFPVHPGNMVWTRLNRNSLLLKLLFMFFRPFTKSHGQAASSIVFAAFAPEMEDSSGIYINNCFPTKPHAIALDSHFRERVWKQTFDIINQFEQQHGMNQ